LKGKVIAMSDKSTSMSLQKKMMGDETVEDEIDEDAYIGVELNVSQSVVNVRKKRLMLINQYEKYNKKKEPKEEKRVIKKSRSRS
jgi:hypothetical protein